MGLCPKRGEQDVGLSIFKGHTDVVCPKSWGTPFIRVYPLGYIIPVGYTTTPLRRVYSLTVHPHARGVYNENT